MSFAPIEDSTVVLVNNGVWNEYPLHVYAGMLFAKVGGGFVRINKDGTCSKPGLRVEVLKYERTLFVDRFGRLCVADGEGRRPALAQPDGTVALLGAGS